MNPDEMVYRSRVVEAFLGNGIPLEKTNGCRFLLQRSGNASTDAAHLKHFIPKIESSEKNKLTQEMEGEYVSSSFDGTSRLGEAVNMVNRWCTADFHLEKRLTMFKTVLKHMDHKELARLIGEKLLRELKITVLHHVAFERDSCKVNGCAVEKLNNLFDSSEDILCLCHTLCHVGEHIELTTLDAFMHHWIGLVYSHAGAKAAWKELIGKVTGFSNVRWYAKAEIEMEIATNFGLLEKAIETFEERGYGDAHTKAMRLIYEEKTVRLELELEDRLSGPPHCEARYDCSEMYEMLRLVRAVDPSFAVAEQIGHAWMNDMAKIKPLSANDLISGMKSELPAYLAAAQGATFDHKNIDVFTVDMLTWWRNNGKKFPSWALAARIIFAFSPNSAACERVFSLLASMFTKEQHSALADQLQAALMLKYNKRPIG